MWPTHSPNSGWSALVRLAVCTAAIALIWLAILPFVGRQEGVNAYIRRNERLGIDPSAKFYTEIPAMPELYQRVQNRRVIP